MPVNRSVVENYMKYFTISEAGVAIECQCISERYLALEIESPSPMEGYPVQPVPWWRDVNARDPGGLKSQFLRSAKRPVRDGAASGPVSRRPQPAQRAGAAAYTPRTSLLSCAREPGRRYIICPPP